MVIPQQLLLVYCETQPVLKQATFGRDRSPGLILGLRPANERLHYKVTASLTGWVQS